MFLKIIQNSQENTRATVSLLIKLQASCVQLYLKRGSGVGVFREFCEISKNTFFTEHLWATASIFYRGNSMTYIWVKVFKIGLSKICRRQPLKNLKCMIFLGIPNHFMFFKGCLPQISLGPFLNILTPLMQWSCNLESAVLLHTQHIRSEFLDT